MDFAGRSLKEHRLANDHEFKPKTKSSSGKFSGPPKRMYVSTLAQLIFSVCEKVGQRDVPRLRLALWRDRSGRVDRTNNDDGYRHGCGADVLCVQ